MTGQRGRARLPHFRAFEWFLGATSSDKAAQLRALVALGLYMESEGRWFRARSQDVTPAEHDERHQTRTLEHELKTVRDTADSIVSAFVVDVNNAYQKKVLDEFITKVNRMQEKRATSFAQSAFSVIVGSAIWTACLFGVAVALKYEGVDLLGIVKAVH